MIHEVRSVLIFACVLLFAAIGGARADEPAWQYGAFLDTAVSYDSNHPSNHLFRSRGTTFHVNEWDINMAAVYLRKAATVQSRFGEELTLQAGLDSQIFGFSATAPNVRGANWLRHFGPTDASFLAPVGNGLTLQGGIFNSLIGYDSLYAKDNFTYTRPWGADFTPYLMMGVNASYPFTDKLTATAYVINGYWHLAHANNVPSSGVQIAYAPSGNLNLKETMLAGPHQRDTSFQFWRFLSDSIAEWKKNKTTIAFETFVGTERVVAPENRHAIWLSAQLPIHRAITPRFSITVRPEVYWDRDGRTTGYRQTVKANTTTLEVRLPTQKFVTILRLEHRIDDSRGPEGGFFIDGGARLTPTQNLVIFAAIFTFDAHR